MNSILTDLKNFYVNIRGFHTDRQLIVFESDDWGSIRMPSREIFRELQSMGDFPERDGFLRNDCLENEKDIKALLEVLMSVRDMNGRPAVFTNNFAMANPNFDEIDLSKGTYAFEPFYKTYDRYYPSNRIIELFKEGTEKGCFCPQLHCREHLNVNRWMHDLKEQKEPTMIAFNKHMIGIGASFSDDNIFGYMDSFNTDYTDVQKQSEILKDAANIFFETFGYRSKTFVASCFVWSNHLEQFLKKEGIEGIQSSIWQNIPLRNAKKQFKRKIHFLGEKNKFGQIYTVRNCSYEPAYNQDADIQGEKCFFEVVKSFRNKKPAIINSHRFNYISSINPHNAEKNLVVLKEMLSKILDEFHNVEFVSTPELIDTIKREKHE